MSHHLETVQAKVRALLVERTQEARANTEAASAFSKTVAARNGNHGEQIKVRPALLQSKSCTLGRGVVQAWPGAIAHWVSAGSDHMATHVLQGMTLSVLTLLVRPRETRLLRPCS